MASASCVKRQYWRSQGLNLELKSSSSCDVYSVPINVKNRISIVPTILVESSHLLFCISLIKFNSQKWLNGVILQEDFIFFCFSTNIEIISGKGKQQLLNLETLKLCGNKRD